MLGSNAALPLESRRGHCTSVNHDGRTTSSHRVPWETLYHIGCSLPHIKRTAI